jgi:predicted Zn-dependent protease
MARLDVAADRVAGTRRLDVGLERRDGFGAWAWPDGRVRVTPALVHALDDDALAAVLAHELAHLRLGRHGRPSAVAGDAASSDVEHEADRIGCAILVERGIAPAAMVGMLRVLARGAALDLTDRIDAAARACIAP